LRKKTAKVPLEQVTQATKGWMNESTPEINSFRTNPISRTNQSMDFPEDSIKNFQVQNSLSQNLAVLSLVSTDHQM